MKLTPEASDAIVQVSTPLLMPQVAPPSSATVHERPALVGSVSVIDTPVAVPAPMFVTLILNPMSVPALTVPWSAVYGATKAFVLSFSEALHYEYRDRRVQITVVCPGGRGPEPRQSSGPGPRRMSFASPLCVGSKCNG